MATLPRQFHDAYDERGDTFFEVARLLIDHHGHQYTQPEIATEVGVSQSRVSDFTQVLTEDGWVNRHDGQTTFVWNTEHQNPAEPVAPDAVFGLYRDLARVCKKHTRTSTGLFALVGFCFFVAAAVVLVAALFRWSGAVGMGGFPARFYLLSGAGLAFGGLVLTAIAPLRASVGRVLCGVRE